MNVPMSTTTATTTSAPKARNPRADAAGASSILVWDAPVRLMHWLMVLCFAGAWLSAESERWRLLHTTLGYSFAGLVLARTLWGLVGTHHARFAAFVRGPRAAAAYLRGLARGEAPHFTGHNPAGAWAIVGLLLLGAATTALGWATDAELRGPLGLDWGEVHEAAASLMLGLVGLHLAGVLVGSLAHRENLVRAMLTGRKRGAAREAIPRARWGVAALLLMLVVSFWAWQWHSAPVDAPGNAAGAGHAGHHASRHAGGHDDDDDD
ncbi:MAG: cytochrome b/b6 domain-containing protein [Burkholderiaceae bacterium]